MLTYINASNVKLYTKVQNIFTFLKVAVCVLIIGIGLYELCTGIDTLKVSAISALLLILQEIHRIYHQAFKVQITIQKI